MTPGDAVAPIELKYLYEDRDRHGNLRRYFRQRIPNSSKYRKRRLWEEPGTAAFHDEFSAAMADRPYVKAGEILPPARPRVVEHSLRWLIEKYYRECAEFRAYDPATTQPTRRNIFIELCAEPATEGSDILAGDLPCDMPKSAIKLLVDRKAVTSIHAANARLKAIRKLQKWAASTTPPLIEENVAKTIDLLEPPHSDGHHTWTLHEIDTYLQRHPIGTKQHLALMLFLLLGQRISDISRVGKQHIRRPDQVSAELRALHPGRWLAFRQHKNRNRNPVDLVIPILPQLEAVIEASPCGRLFFLETEHHRPYSTKGLGNWFERQCIAAGVPGRAHGLRKAGATIAAERGATPHQLMMIFGWKTIEQAQLYTEKVRQQLVAASAMYLITYLPAATASPDQKAAANGP